MSAETVITAGIRPELFEKRGLQIRSRTVITVTLAAIMLLGFGFRASQLGAEGLSEDELNKLQAVEEYRQHGLSSVNGEHPFLMKALMTISVVASEGWNSTVAVNHEGARISTETALRFPSVLFGTLTALLVFILVSELFGTEVALISAALWALDPTAISFNRIAKEDTFLLFFFLLANVFWLRSQRVAESGKRSPEKLYWATGAAYGAMMASKYMPHLMAVGVSYYYIFQGIPQTRWRMGKKRFLIFFAVMGAVFLLLNPTVLLPDTWRQMLAFASYKRMGHDGYEFMGRVYSHKLMDWLYGVPWYYYFVFMFVKLPVATIVSFLVGLPLMFRRRAGDGRFFLFFWVLIGFIPFVLFGGKFTRYFAPVLAVVLIIAGYGLQHAARFLTGRLLKLEDNTRRFASALLYSVVILASVWSSVEAVPHYRLYTNWLGGGETRAGSFFPQDEFYDTSVRDTVYEISRRARVGASVATETVGLASYYAERAGRRDLKFVSLSDAEALKNLSDGDFIIVARGRRYFSNEALLNELEQSGEPAFRINAGKIPSVKVYVVDERVRALLAAKSSAPPVRR